jgi:diguanylate cyclase (GGDEF)-like protein/PAS domain S-box-containing protein
MRPFDSIEVHSAASTPGGDLDEVRSLMELAFMTSPRGVVVTNPRDEVITLVNPAFARMHGGEVEDYVGRPLRDVFAHESAARLAKIAPPENEDGYAVYDSVHVRADGSTFAVATEIFTARDRDGRPLYRIGHLTDLTGRHEAEQERDAAQQRFETAFADAPIGMALVGLDGRFLKVNRALCELTGYSEAELQERTFQDITDPADLDADLAHVKRLMQDMGDSYQMEKRYLTKGGATIWILLSVSIVRDERRQPRYFISQIQDITERKRMEQHLHRLADHDFLTGLWNRRRFEEELEREIGRANRYGERAALLYIDLDEFKQVNDRLGHKVGDDLLRVIGTRMSDRVRRNDLCARLGGDEFAVILANVSPDQAVRIANEFVTLVRESSLAVAGQTINCTGSIGLVHIDADTRSEQDVLVAADIAMYDAKGAGGDRVTVSGPHWPT